MSALYSTVDNGQQLSSVRALKQFTHVWYWGPRMGEPSRKGQHLIILIRGGRNSALVELETGEQVVCSRNCYRRLQSANAETLNPRDSDERSV